MLWCIIPQIKLINVGWNRLEKCKGIEYNFKKLDKTFVVKLGKLCF